MLIKIFFCLHIYVKSDFFFIYAYTIGRHTGINIKTHYDKVVKLYDISDNIFKVVADQGANVKKGFLQQRECDQSDELLRLTSEMLEEQRKKDLQAHQEILRQQLESEIEKMNSTDIDKASSDTRKRSREEVLEFLNDDYDYDYTDHNSDGDDSLLDADDNLDDVIDELVEGFVESAEQISMNPLNH